jgi:trk system potassium uptake protein TrkH
VFHAVSAFNNAGFALYSDSLVRFAGDPWTCLPIAVAVIAGGPGFAVLFELRRQLCRPGRWSLHTKITVSMSGLLLAVGTVFVTASEWANSATLGGLDAPARLLAGFFGAVMPRTAGFNSLDVAEMHEGTWLGMDLLMLIGGGSAGTAGGIKVTTFALRFVIIDAKVRGDPTVHVFDRRVEPRTQRQALTVAVLAAAAIGASTLFLIHLTRPPIPIPGRQAPSLAKGSGDGGIAVIGLGRFGQSLALELMERTPRCSASTPAARPSRRSRAA